MRPIVGKFFCFFCPKSSIFFLCVWITTDIVKRSCVRNFSPYIRVVQFSIQNLCTNIQLAVAGDVFDGVLVCAVLFPTRCLGCDLGLNWVSAWEVSCLYFMYKWNWIYVVYLKWHQWVGKIDILYNLRTLMKFKKKWDYVVFIQKNFHFQVQSYHIQGIFFCSLCFKSEIRWSANKAEAVGPAAGWIRLIIKRWPGE